MRRPVVMVRVPPLTITRAALAALVGCVAVQWLPALPIWPVGAISCVAFLIAVVSWRRHLVIHALVIALFASWACLQGRLAMDRRLPDDLSGKDATVSGRIVDLPRRSGADASFVFVADEGIEGVPHGRWRLTWYRAPRVPAACETWRFTVRLRRPRGAVNPGGADAERVALQRGITATGYVRSAGPDARVGATSCIDGWRADIAQALDRRLGTREARVVKALAIGDTRGLDAADWDIARSTGVSHLMAISGFHVGVAAGAGVLIIRMLYALFPRLALRLPRQLVQSGAGLMVATAYGLLAGMGLPTVRTLLMIAVVLIAGMARRRAAGLSLLAFALLCVLVSAPLSVLSAGFWLSFAGVGFLVLCVTSKAKGWKAWAGELLRAQAVMSTALLPLSLWWFGSASLVGFVANLIAAPLVSFAVVPLTLLGCATLAWPFMSTPLLQGAAWLLSWQWRLLTHMADWPGSRVGVADGGLVPVVMATVGAAWLFAPRGLPLRSYGAAMFLPLVFPLRSDPPQGAFRAWVLDVGQGLAVVIHTHTRTLVYDTGPAYASGSDAGAGVVLPSITALGIGPVDALVVSHGDIDHAGGAAAIAARYPRAVYLSGEPERLPFDAEPCEAGDAWTWDGVRFEFLAVPLPRLSQSKVKGNDRSCVLAVEGREGRLLLTGDIGEKAERRMDVDDLASLLPTVTTVAHHGSRYSSSARWLDAVHPKLAVVSAGWRNRFGHPHADVLARHAAVGAGMIGTPESGAVQLDFPADGAPMVTRRWRTDERRYWRE